MNPPNPPRRDFTAYLILPCAMLMQACLGATYAWPTFVKSLRDSTGLGQGLVQLPFTVFYIVFPATVLFSGALLARLGPRWSAVIGSVVFGAGWLTASLGHHGFPLTMLGIGVLGGIGVGIAYLAPITSLMLWFPRHKGLVTGLVVGGFGAGAAAVNKAGEFLMGTRGLSVYQTFATLGLTYMAVAGLAGLAMKRPPMHSNLGGAAKSQSEPPQFLTVIRERAFQVLYCAMFSGLVAGFLVLANLKQLAGRNALQSGISAVALFAFANAFGRIVWGSVFDRLKSPKRVVQANLALQGMLLVAAPWLLFRDGGLQIAAAFAGFNYGGVLVLYASSIASRWGADRVGHIYGWLFSANIIASIAPVLAGLAFDRWNSFTVPLLVAAALLIGSTLVMELLPAERASEGSPREPLQAGKRS